MQFIKLTGSDSQGLVYLNTSHIVSLWRDERCTRVNTINQTIQECVGVVETPEQILALTGGDLTQRKARAFDVMTRLGLVLLDDGMGGWDIADQNGDVVLNTKQPLLEAIESIIEAIEAALAKAGKA